MRRETRFVLGLDLDDVVFDFRRGLWEFVVAETKNPDLPYPRTWDFSEWDLADGELTEWFARATEDGLYRRLPLIPGADKALQAISDADVRIRVVTHRLYMKGYHERIGADTFASLETNNIPFWDACFVADKATVDCDLNIDDAPHNLTALVQSGGRVLCFDQPYNQDVPYPRARNWDEVLDHLRVQYGIPV